MQKTKKINSKFILKYMALFFVSLLLANARVSGVSPFLFAFFFFVTLRLLNPKRQISLFPSRSRMACFPYRKFRRP